MKTYLLLLLIVSLASMAFAQTNSPSFIAPEREWRDGKGNVVNATWKSISRNGAIIWLQSTIDKKPLKVNVRNLSTNDQAFVNAYLSNCRKQHLVWDGGVFISQGEFLKRLEQKLVDLEKQRELQKRMDAALDKNKAYNDRMAAAHKAAMERKLVHVRANPSIYSPAERRLAQAGTQAPFADPIVANPIPSSTVRRKKKNWSFVELQSGVDFDADAQRQQEYEQQIAARQAYSRQRDDAQFQLQEAERQHWFAEQQRIQAEQSARDNRIPSFQGGLDSQAEISRQQEMWAEQQKRDAEMRAHQFP